jgi:hypothetical protein
MKRESPEGDVRPYFRDDGRYWLNTGPCTLRGQDTDEGRAEGGKVTISENGPAAAAAGVSALALSGVNSFYREIDADQRTKIQAAGRRFVQLTEASHCLVLAGRIVGGGDPGEPTERRVQRCCEERFGFPKSPPLETINVILDSTGGSLDSAFKTVLYLSKYAENIGVYVPRKAKSAGTLLAIGANTIFMSPFSELGPLDTQVRDPRNPTDYVSALDCYQSVDYVRDFGFGTLSQALKELAFATQGRIPLVDFVNTAAQFAASSITPMITQVKALDLGGWGRSLKIGEKYAQILLARVDPIDRARSEKIARRLVYGYTHHLFPIDITEAEDMNLKPQQMSAEQYKSAFEIVSVCGDNEICIEFIDSCEEPAERGGETTIAR